MERVESAENLATTDSSAKFSGTARTESTVILSTAIVRVRYSVGKLQTVRVLLGSRSQVSAITSKCTTKLRLRCNKSRMKVMGLSQQPVTKVKGVTHCKLIPLHVEGPQFCASSVIVLHRIAMQLPSERLPSAVRERYHHLVFADPEFDVPEPIDMLFGSDLYPHMLQSKADIIHSTGLPSSMNTPLLKKHNYHRKSQSVGQSTNSTVVQAMVYLRAENFLNLRDHSNSQRNSQVVKDTKLPV